MSAGSKPLKKAESLATPKTMTCLHCNKELSSKEFYDSDSEIYRAFRKIPYCKECLDEIYHSYLKRYKDLSYTEPERKSVERICMVTDLYYSDKVFDSAVKLSESGKFIDSTFISLYIKQVKLYQYRNKDYDSTIAEKFKEMKDKNAVMSVYTEHDVEVDERVDAAIKLFGIGFEKSDYVYLYDQYSDWTARHECNTKANKKGARKKSWR